MRARQSPPFGWHYSWVPLNEDSLPNLTHSSAFKQPETIRVRWDEATKDSKREVVADIVPDRGLFGCEYAMIHTFPEFEKRIVARLDDTDEKAHGKMLYSLMNRCFQGKALTKWTKVADKVALDDRTADTFKVTQQEYLESLAKIKNLGDCLIRQLRDRSKPSPMPFNDYIDRRDEWRRHLNGPYLRHTFAKPNDQEWAEQIFSQQPKTHQARYAEKHEDVETDIDKLKLFFKLMSWLPG